MRFTYLRISIVALYFTGCASSPNLVSVTKGGIKGHGGISRKLERIDLIQIRPRELSEGEIHDLWVGLSATNQMTLTEITEDAIKEIGVPAKNYYSAPSPETSYFVGGYSFSFEGGQLVAFDA